MNDHDLGAAPPLRVGIPSRLGEMLVRNGLVSSEEVHNALAEQAAGSEWRLGRLLVRQGVLDDDTLIEAIADQFHVPVVDLSDETPAACALARLSREAAFQLQALPTGVDGDLLVVAVADPPTRELRVAIERAAGMPVRLVLCPADQLAAALGFWYSAGIRRNDATDPPDPADPEWSALVAEGAGVADPEEPEPPATEPVEDATPGAPAAEPVEDVAAGEPPAPEPDEDAAHRQVVAWLVAEALRHEASAVHLDSDADGLRIRYRVEGGMVRGPSLRHASGTVVCERLLSEASLEVAANGVQERTVSAVVEGRWLRCRVAAVSTPGGTHVVVEAGSSECGAHWEDLSVPGPHVRALRRVLVDARGVVVVAARSAAVRDRLCRTLVDEIGPDDHVVVAVPLAGGIEMPRGAVLAPHPDGPPENGVRAAAALGADTLVLDDRAETLRPAFDAASDLLVVLVADGDDPSALVTAYVDALGGLLVAGLLRAVLIGRDDEGAAKAEVHLVTERVCRAILDVGAQG